MLNVFCTVVLNRTNITFRVDRFADVLPVGDKKSIYIYPIFYGEFFPERKFCFFRIFGFNIAEPVKNSMNVNVNTNCWFVKPSGKHKISCLTPDAVEFYQLFYLVRNFSSKLFINLARKFYNLFCFVVCVNLNQS